MNIKIRGMGMLVDFNPGIFTGVKLSAYIANDKKDYLGARKVINNTDEDELIAEYAKKFEEILASTSVAPERT